MCSLHSLGLTLQSSNATSSTIATAAVIADGPLGSAASAILVLCLIVSNCLDLTPSCLSSRSKCNCLTKCYVRLRTTLLSTLSMIRHLRMFFGKESMCPHRNILGGLIEVSRYI